MRVLLLMLAACASEPKPTATPRPIVTEVASSEPPIMGENGRMPEGATQPRMLVPLLNLPFPKEADKQKIDSADVSLRFVVSERGEPSRFEIVRGHPAFHQATIDAVKKMKFTPGTLQGKPRAAYMQLTVQYRR